MIFETLLAGMVCVGITGAVVSFVLPWLERKRIGEIKLRMEKFPQDITECRIEDNDPVTVTVCFVEEEAIVVRGLHGDEAVAFFNWACTLSRAARFAVTMGGENIMVTQGARFRGQFPPQAFSNYRSAAIMARERAEA